MFCMKETTGFAIILAAIALIFAISLVFASAPPPSSICYVQGIIQSVEFKAAYNESCLATDSCPTDSEIIHPDRYYLTLNVTIVSYIRGDTTYYTCENAFPVGNSTTIYINKENVIPRDHFKNGDIIEGEVASTFRPFLNDYILDPNNGRGHQGCNQDSDCKVKFTACNCGNECILKSQDSNIDCARVCSLSEINTSITSCACENNKCVGKTNTSNLDCKNLYWIDNTNKECGQKQFCGAYMYYGLQTFDTKGECERAVNHNENKTFFNLSNGRKAEIKVMPETASAKAIERLGELGFNVTLKEVGSGNSTKAVYHLEAIKDAKILGFIKTKAKVQMDIDAENDGKVISVKKPWWSFLASGI